MSPMSVAALNYWQSRYQNNNTPWNKGQPSPGLVDYCQKNQLTGTILVPGCGHGHDVRLLAAAYPDSRIIAMDIVPEAIELAEKCTEHTNVEYVIADYLNPENTLEDNFDWIVEHTLFCAIEPSQRASYAAATAYLLRPGGKYLAVFYMEPEAGRDRPPFGVERQELDDLFGTGFRLETEWMPQRNYESRVGRELMRVMRRID